MQVSVTFHNKEALERFWELVNLYQKDISIPQDGAYGVGQTVSISSTTLDLTNFQDWVDGVSAPQGYVWRGTELVSSTKAKQDDEAKQIQASDAQFSKLLSVFGGAVVSHAHLDAIEKELHDFEDNVDAPWPLHEEIAAFRQCSVYEAHLFIEQALTKYYTALHNVVAGMRDGQTPIEDLIVQQDLTPPQVQVVQGADLAYYRPKYLILVDKATDDFWAQRLDGTIFGNMYALMAAKEAEEFIAKGYPAGKVPKLVQTYATIKGLGYNAAADAIVATQQQLVALAAQVEPQRVQAKQAIRNAQTKAEMSNAYRSYKTFLANLP